MELWLLLIVLLGFFTYYIVKRQIAPITRTPLWIFWLVMMAPALLLTTWFLIMGTQKVPPPSLMVGSFVLSLLVSWWLIALGRSVPPEVKKNGAEPQAVNSSESQETQEADSKVRPIAANEEKTLRDCFPWGIYYLQTIDYRPQAILCRGKLRAIPDVAYQTIKENVERAFGDRFLVMFQESFQGQPFFALVPNPWSKTQVKLDSEPITRPGFALGLLLITLFTTTVIGVEISGVSVEQLQANAAFLLKGLPYSLSLIAILGIHELSHYLTALHYKIRTTLPYFIPVPFFLGTFGAFIQMRSPVPHRKALFDVAIAGPVGGFIVTLPILLWGLSQSEIVPIAEKSSLLTFQALDPRFSCLFALLSKLALGSAFLAGKALDLHPLAVAGYIGLIVTALNLMPVGQLDGGHIIHAMFGQRSAIAIAQFARVSMFILALIQPDFLLWAIILLLMPVTAQPALNDVTELDNWRDFWGLLSIVLLLSILLPLPGAVAQWLHI
jgi:membrane-associated protease RseP (regulator of RpoE activity)